MSGEVGTVDVTDVRRKTPYVHSTYRSGLFWKILGTRLEGSKSRGTTLSVRYREQNNKLMDNKINLDTSLVHTLAARHKP